MESIIIKTNVKNYKIKQLNIPKGEASKNESLIDEITELRIKEGKAQVTIDEYGRSLGIKEDLIKKIIEAMEVINYSPKSHLVLSIKVIYQQLIT